MNDQNQKSWIDQKERDLLQAVLKLETLQEAERFFLDLCTPAELRSLADRWRVARLLDQEIPYRQIHEKTGVSTTTVTRVARSLMYGESGYRIVLNRLRKKEANA